MPQAPGDHVPHERLGQSREVRVPLWALPSQRQGDERSVSSPLAPGEGGTAQGVTVQENDAIAVDPGEVVERCRIGMEPPRGEIEEIVIVFSKVSFASGSVDGAVRPDRATMHEAEPQVERPVAIQGIDHEVDSGGVRRGRTDHVDQSAATAAT